MGFRLVSKSVTLNQTWRRHGVDWGGHVQLSTPLLPEVIPEIDANPMTFMEGEWGRRGVSVSGSVR